MLGLHHRGCAASDWRGGGVVADVGVTVMRHSAAATLSFTTLAVMLPGAAAGKPFPKPLLVVNPSLEAVMLRQDTSGRWRVHLDRQYADAGMVAPGRKLHLDRPITGATAVLAAGEVAVRVRGALDPAAITRLSDLQPVLTGDRSLLGWVALHQ